MLACRIKGQKTGCWRTCVVHLLVQPHHPGAAVGVSWSDFTGYAPGRMAPFRPPGGRPTAIELLRGDG